MTAVWQGLPVAIREAGPAGIKADELALMFQCREKYISNALSRTRIKQRERGEEANVWTLLDIGFPARYFGAKEWRDAAKAARGPMQLHLPKHAKPKAAPVMSGPVVGPIPDAVVLPHQPVYSRHQLAALPPGFKSLLSASECRPWAMAASR